MKISALRAAIATGAMLTAGCGAAYADALGMPAMTGPLVANPSPTTFDAGLLGNIYVTGAVSGFASWQNNTVPGDRDFHWDVSNGQVFVQKTDGLIQFFVQVGAYDFPSLGAPIVSSSYETGHTFGALPQAYLKIAPSDTFSIEAGKLPTLIGAEYTFSFENMNMERGLLWNQENAVNRGVQANYTMGPVALSVSLNDGFYSNRYSWVWGSLAWTIDPANSLSFVGGGNLASTGISTFVTPYYQNNSAIYNVIYTYSNAPWTITPYFQYTNVPSNTKRSIFASASTASGALLVNYNIDPNWNLAARAEYIAQSGGDSGIASTNLLYGTHSNAWSITVTPTYQYKIFFARAEASYVSVGSASGFVFGAAGDKTDQFRLMFETGVLF